MSDKHYLVSKVTNSKDEQIHWQADEVDLKGQEPDIITVTLNEALESLVLDVPKGCNLELKIVQDPGDEVEVSK